MSNTNYITGILELKDNNIKFYENFYKKEKVNGIVHKIFEGFLSYTSSHCPKCGVMFDNNFEKHGFIIFNVKMPDLSGYKAILRLHKQRYLCKHCNKAFTLTSRLLIMVVLLLMQLNGTLLKIQLKSVLKRILLLIIMFILILWKELLILIMIINDYINTIYLKYYLLMNLNLLKC